MTTICLQSEYLAPVAHYILAFHAEKILIETQEHYVKQSFRNRCEIASANGIMPLTIPIEKASVRKPCMKDMRISDHGNWRHLHWNAIRSSYNSSAFFEYYQDDFRPLYEKRYEFLLDFNEAMREVIFQSLELDKVIEYTSDYQKELNPSIMDLRPFAEPQKEIELKTKVHLESYYQVFQNKFGFQSDLSIIDLLFNMGPEAQLILKNSSK